MATPRLAKSWELGARSTPTVPSPIPSPQPPAPSLVPLRGQALLELSFFGSIALVALAFLIQKGLVLNYQQELQQETFRLALQYASEKRPGGVEYKYFRNRIVPDPSREFSYMPGQLIGARARATWTDGLFDPNKANQQRHLVWQLNEQGNPGSGSNRSIVQDIGQFAKPTFGHVSKDMRVEGEITQTHEQGGTLRPSQVKTTERTQMFSFDTVDPVKNPNFKRVLCSAPIQVCKFGPDPARWECHEEFQAGECL